MVAQVIAERPTIPVSFTMHLIIPWESSMISYRIKLNRNTRFSEFTMLGTGLAAALLVFAGLTLAAHAFSSLPNGTSSGVGAAMQVTEGKAPLDVRG